MLLFVRKPDDFTLNARAISWLGCLYSAGGKRSTMQIIPKQLVYLLVGICNPARHLRAVYFLGHKRKRHRGSITMLDLQPVQITGAGIQPGRCVGRHSSEFQPYASQTLRELHTGRLIKPTA